MVIISSRFYQQSILYFYERWSNVSHWTDWELRVGLCKLSSTHGWRISHGFNYLRNKFSLLLFQKVFWTTMIIVIRYHHLVRTKMKLRINYYWEERAYKNYSRDIVMKMSWQARMQMVRNRRPIRRAVI